MRLILIVMFSLKLLFAIGTDEGNSATALPESIREAIESSEFFEGDYTLDTSVHSYCKPACREISSAINGLTTKIVDFDATTGVSFCKVYLKNNESLFGTDLGITANTLNSVCVEKMEDIKVDTTNSDLSSRQNTDYTNLSETFGTLSPTRMTLSRLIGGIVTLDTDFINLTDTESTQHLVRTGSANSRIYTMSNAQDEEERLISVADSLSSSNMAFYASLFYHLDEVYEYLVSYVFVFVALFFVVMHASKVLLKKLEKKTTAFDEGWKSKMAVVVVTVSIFFLPVRFDDNYSSTVFQRIWTYFVQESASIADSANATAAKVLVKGVYSTAGVSGVEEEASLLALEKKEKLKVDAYERYLAEFCKERFPTAGGFQSYDRNEIEHLESLKYEDANLEFVTYASCRTIEQKYNVSLSTLKNYTYNLDRIELSYGDSGTLKQRLDEQAQSLATKVADLGWYSAIIAPTVEISTKINFMLDKNEDAGRQQLHQDNMQAINTSQYVSRDDVAQDNTLAQALNVSPDKDKDLGESMGTFIYYILPGVGHMKRAMGDLGGEISQKVLGEMGVYNKELIQKSVTNINNLLKLGDTQNEQLMAHFSLVAMIKALLVYVPLLIAVVAGLVVVVMYLYELVVFSFITPFIVAFAITSGQSRKILDFLVMALTLFLKPVLIVIFIYLSVFLYNFVENFMTIMVNEQFLILANASYTKFTSFMIVFLMELLNLLIIVFSSMFLWRVIMGGPSFTYKMVGLDKVDNTTQIASGVQQSMGKYGFRV
jgi:hypothetical protein